MYLDHFGLSESPFRITPHTDFFFSGANRGATLNALIYAITNDEGIVKISGEVGSGKTMLCRVLMERLPEHVDIVYLANPSLSRDDILYAIMDELGLEVPKDARASAVQRTLQEYLVALHGEGRQVVVLIDEAHAMPPETLEAIRLLSNLESNRNKLLQLALFGQPELNDILARPDMRQLKERITHNFTLEPLVRNDIAQYLDFRMRAAGYRGPEVFSAEAIKLISGSSLGLTRRINILADKALLAAFSNNSHLITSREIKAAIRDSEFARAVRPPSRNYLLPAISGVALLLLITVVFLLRNQTGVPPAPAVVAAQPIADAANPMARGPVIAAAQVKAEATQPAPQAASPTTVPAPAPAPAQAGKQTAAATAPSDDWPELGPITRQRVEESQAWLASVSDDRWFLQFVRTDVWQAARVEKIAVEATKLLTRDQVRVYAVKFHGVRRVGVIYGDFASHAEAIAARSTLPRPLRAMNPYPRQAKRLH